MLGKSLTEVVGYTDVDGAVTTTGEKVDVIQFGLSSVPDRRQAFN
jgi:hypothetical protein